VFLYIYIYICIYIYIYIYIYIFFLLPFFKVCAFGEECGWRAQDAASNTDGGAVASTLVAYHPAYTMINVFFFKDTLLSSCLCV